MDADQAEDLLFLTQRIPYPPIKGEKIRPLQILRHLSQRYRVHLGCLIDDKADWAHVDTVRALCADAYFARLDRRVARIACTRGLLTGEALSVSFFKDGGLARWVRGVLDRVQPAVVFVNSGNMAPYVLDQPGAASRTTLVDLADVDSEKWRAYAEGGRGPMRYVHAREWRRVAALEARIAREADWSTFVTESEAALFRQLLPDAAERIRAVVSGVDATYFDPALTHAPLLDPSRPTFVFTGTMDYPPNVDAVTWFAADILPRIRQTLPDAAFAVVGSNPAPAVQALAGTEGITVTGRVADVRPYLAHAVAGVAPMRIARGIQNKVLEAMAMARPAIVTSDALEGIDAAPGREVVLADDADAFAAACVRLAADRDAGDAIGRAARARVLADYDWSARLRGFDALLAAARHTESVA